VHGATGAPAGVDAELIGSIASATRAVSDAQAAVDAAQKAYDAANERHDRASALATIADQRAKQARAAAKASAAKLLLELHSRPGAMTDPTSLSVLFNHGGGDLMQRLSALHRLGQLSADPSTLAARAHRDAATAKTAASAAAAAHVVVDAVPLADAKAALGSAQDALHSAQAALDALHEQLTAAPGLLAVPNGLFDGLLSGASWVSPVPGPITDVFGLRPSQPAGTSPFHPGTDIGAGCGTWIRAASSGTVESTGPNGSYGNWVLIDHGDGVQTAYGHIVDGGTAVTPGEHVDAGQPIAEVGTTGASTGCHLHLEVRVNGEQIDPQPFLAARGVTVGQ
jgi:murein DD-endopeptidase MepM/ murein hydrolase activator NlpD